MLTKVNLFRKSLLIKNFSLLSKIKKHGKSEEISTAQVFQNLKNPDDLKIEIENEPKIINSKKEKFNKNPKALTEEELEILKNLPKETISKFVFINILLFVCINIA